MREVSAQYSEDALWKTKIQSQLPDHHDLDFSQGLRWVNHLRHITFLSISPASTSGGQTHRATWHPQALKYTTIRHRLLVNSLCRVEQTSSLKSRSTQKQWNDDIEIQCFSNMLTTPLPPKEGTTKTHESRRTKREAKQGTGSQKKGSVRT